MATQPTEARRRVRSSDQWKGCRQIPPLTCCVTLGPLLPSSRWTGRLWWPPAVGTMGGTVAARRGLRRSHTQAGPEEGGQPRVTASSASGKACSPMKACAAVSQSWDHRRPCAFVFSFRASSSVSPIVPLTSARWRSRSSQYGGVENTVYAARERTDRMAARHPDLTARRGRRPEGSGGEGQSPTHRRPPRLSPPVSLAE